MRFPTVAPVQQVFWSPRLFELIGRGGRGAVFKARQPNLERLVVVKTLPQKLANRSGFGERFKREVGGMLAEYARLQPLER
jgi:eukaryotic-like serine/threonine-protein kinase